MTNESPVGALSALSRDQLGVFRGRAALEVGVTRKQLTALCKAAVVERVYPDTYRMTAVARGNEQDLRAALLWAGSDAAAAGRSAGETYGFEGVHAEQPELVVGAKRRLRSEQALVHRCADLTSLMLRSHRGIRVTGPEATIVTLAAVLAAEPLEIACEDARRRRITSVPALRAYLARFPHRSGVTPLRELLRELDPAHASRSTLEVKTRRLLVARGFSEFVREFPLAWNGRVYRFDFAFERTRAILETNGRRWHDDPIDYERDNEKWSVPARHGYRIVFATWDKVVHAPDQLVDELRATMAA
jgi:very-short-patch-repair endonuclease